MFALKRIWAALCKEFIHAVRLVGGLIPATYFIRVARGIITKGGRVDLPLE